LSINLLEMDTHGFRSVKMMPHPTECHNSDKTSIS
jgi:hypothetical protein